MSRRSRPTKLLVAVPVLSALSLVGCSPPNIGYVTLARHDDGAILAVVVLCEGVATDIELLIGAPADAAGSEVAAWSGEISEPGITEIPLTAPGWSAASGTEYAVYGHGISDDRFFGLSDGMANLWGESEIDGSLLEALGPEEVIDWDAESRRAVAVSLEEYRSGLCEP